MIEVEHDMRQQRAFLPGGDNAHRGDMGHACAGGDIFSNPPSAVARISAARGSSASRAFCFRFLARASS